jgi:hypothetical protein
MHASLEVAWDTAEEIMRMGHRRVAPRTDADTFLEILEAEAQQPSTAPFVHGFPFFLYAGFCRVEVCFVWRCLPATKNRSLEDISGRWSIKDAQNYGS